MKGSTQTVLARTQIPRHITVITDDNGHWTEKWFLPRVMGHKRGLDALEEMVRNYVQAGVEYLTVFAFSTENWRHPKDEMSLSMGLFLQALQEQAQRLHKNNMWLKIIGSRERFSTEILQGIEAARVLTASNTGLALYIAADYGGRWDILQAANRAVTEGSGEIIEDSSGCYLMLGDTPEPDLFIHTGSETCISNFLLWQIAYAELYFTDTLWPNFDEESFDDMVTSYQKRERRFGRTSEQLPPDQQRS